MSTTYLDTSEAVTQVIANENQIEIPFNFPIYDEKDIEVLKTDGTTGDYVTLALTTDYTVASQYISDVNGQVAGGFITLVTPAIADDKYTCRLNVDIELDTKYTIAGDSMSQSAYVDSQNRVNLQIFQILQQFRRDINNAVTLAPDAVGQASTLPDPADLDAVVNNEANINTVAGNATNINTVANNITNINTANANAGNVNLVAGSIDNMNSVAGSIDNMNSVAGSIDNMNSVAGSIDNMNSVAGSIDNMNSVAGNIGNVNAVVTNQTNINTVAGNITTMQDAINAVPKNNFSTIVAPTNNNDSDDGYSVGSHWIDIYSKVIYICVDNTPSKAVWTKVANDGIIESFSGFTLSNVMLSGYKANTKSGPVSIAFNNDGSKIFILGNGNSTVEEYNLTTPFRLETFVTTNIIFSVSNEDTQPISLRFNSDGSKMFILGDQYDKIYEYELSTPFSINTATYTNISVSVSNEDTQPVSLEFNSDGSKMYMLGDTNDKVYEYELSTPFSINTATYANSNFSVSNEDTQPVSLRFNSDGSKMFILGDQYDKIYEYELSTLFSINTATYTNISVSVSNEDTQPVSLEFNSDGSKMYMLGDTNDKVYEYLLPKPFAGNIEEAYYTNKSFTIDSESSDLESFVFSNDGTRMLVASYYDKFREYVLSVPFDVSTASYLLSRDISDARAMNFNNDGTKLFILSGNARRIKEYSLSQPFSLSSFSYINQSYDLEPVNRIPYGFCFNKDGTKMFSVGVGVHDYYIYEYNLSTPFNISTLSYSNKSFNISGQGSSDSITTSNDGTKFFVSQGRTLYEYELSTPFDINTISYTNRSFNANFDAEDMKFNNNGTKLFTMNPYAKIIYEYSLI
jgi:hypothetical protein